MTEMTQDDHKATQKFFADVQAYAKRWDLARCFEMDRAVAWAAEHGYTVVLFEGALAHRLANMGLPGPKRGCAHFMMHRGEFLNRIGVEVGFVRQRRATLSRMRQWYRSTALKRKVAA